GPLRAVSSLPPVAGPDMASMEAPALKAPVRVGLIQAPPARADHLAAVGLGGLSGGVPALARALSQVPGAHDRPPYGTTERRATRHSQPSRVACIGEPQHSGTGSVLGGVGAGTCRCSHGHIAPNALAALIREYAAISRSLAPGRDK